MIVKYDDETEITITPRFEAALIELMKSEIEMMAITPGFDPDMWYWGRCEIVDLASRFLLRLSPRQFHPSENKACLA